MNDTMLAGMIAKMNNGERVWVADLVERAIDEGWVSSKAEMDALLLSAHSRRVVTLRRRDLILRSEIEKVRASEVRGEAGSTFHTVEL